MVESCIRILLNKSKDIKADVVQDLLPEYLLLQLLVDPEDVGYGGISRPRSYMFLAHTETCEYKVDLFKLYAEIKKQIKKVVQTQPNDYIVSPPAVQQLTTMDMCRRRGLPFEPDISLQVTNYVLFVWVHS